MRLRFLAFSSAALVLVTGCDELLSTTMAVSILTRTPELGQAENMDPGLAGSLPLDELDQSATLAFTGISQREDSTSQETPTPVTGAQVTLSWDGNTVALCDQSSSAADGTYGATSIPTESCSDAALAYVDGSQYTTNVSLGGDTFAIRVTAPGAIAAGNIDFDPAFTSASGNAPGSGLMAHPRNQPLNVSWARDASAGERPCFVTIMRARYNGGTSWTADPEPVYDNTPREPAAMVDLVLGDPAIFADIPGSTFDQTGMYFLILTSTELSTDTDGLQLGSGGLAGRGTAFAFWVD